jgi:hypothetical protein
MFQYPDDATAVVSPEEATARRGAARAPREKRAREKKSEKAIGDPRLAKGGARHLDLAADLTYAKADASARREPSRFSGKGPAPGVESTVRR